MVNTGTMMQHKTIKEKKGLGENNSMYGRKRDDLLRDPVTGRFCGKKWVTVS
jgi:hypothetical protein